MRAAALILSLIFTAAGCGISDGAGGESDARGVVNSSDAFYTGITKLWDTGDVYLTNDATDSINLSAPGVEVFSYRNDGEIPADVGFAYLYEGGLYKPLRGGVVCDGENVAFDVSVNWRGFNGYSYEGRNFDGGAAYALYTVKVERNTENYMQLEKVYIGADFTVDVSKTRIIADGFGYAANPYGAIRVWSLSDGFDAGQERHLYIIGEDEEVDIKAYEDADLTRGSDAVNVITERSEATVRKYFLSYSAPYSINKSLEEANAANWQTSITLPVYEDGLYGAYANALDAMLDIHYFIPRNALFSMAETRYLNAMIFNINIPAGSTRTILINPP